MHRIVLPPPWPGVALGLTFIGDRIGGEDSRLAPAMRRVHQSRCARSLAVDLLGDLGVAAQVIGKGPVGEPVWPDACVGSLSHTEAYAAAAVARDTACRALGVDVEADLPLPPDTDELILRDEERAQLDGARQRIPGADRLLFCAKECVHKAIHPLRKAWLDFQDVAIDLDAAAGRFAVRPVSELSRRAFDGLRADGRFVQREGHLLAVLALF